MVTALACSTPTCAKVEIVVAMWKASYPAAAEGVTCFNAKRDGGCSSCQLHCLRQGERGAADRHHEPWTVSTAVRLFRLPQEEAAADVIGLSGRRFALQAVVQIVDGLMQLGTAIERMTCNVRVFVRVGGYLNNSRHPRHLLSRWERIEMKGNG